jgi:uncharacterized protein YegL
MAGFDVTQFASTKAKPLPIILLLDESGSMRGDKIDKLNEAVQKMISSFKKEETQASEFLVSIIGFGGAGARIINYPTNATDIQFSKLSANGMTPLGGALALAKGIVEDKELTPSRAYRPLVVLVTDGYPNDSWEAPFVDFVEMGRSAKCDRMALSVGEGTDMGMLQRFVAGTGHEVFTTDQADGIVKFFKFVTMSVVTRTRSQNPNLVPSDREVKPLSAPALIEEDSETVDIIYEDAEIISDPKTVEEAPVENQPINLDDEDDFWF